jgi:hypothetical protein
MLADESRPGAAARALTMNTRSPPLNYPEDFDNLIIETRDDLIRCPKSIQNAYCVHQLEAQVNNGGFHAFFGNSSGMFVPETMQALADIGAVKAKKLLEDAALVAYPNGFPSDSSLHESELCDVHDVEEKLGPLDTAFWHYYEPLADMVNAYLAKNH